ncbi:MAG: methionine adenosyltransferase [Parcubacteria group bacterium]|nr:methionine adenosyltransferase [Parcubacteria group bacterium]
MLPFYTVESVTAGHPDKVCDQISDAILDACLQEDSESRVAVETFGGHGLLVIGGEVTTRAAINYESIARKLYTDIGYSDDTLRVIVNVVAQSPDIAQGVDTGGAGDQGIMYGYATDETPEYMPFAVVRVHQLARRLEDVRRSRSLPWLRPDGKTQITVENESLHTVLVSAQHDSHVDPAAVRDGLIREVVEPVLGTADHYEILINPTGRFEQGGFDADTGLTGRKIMVDTYGGLVCHDGGCFSGKDPTKVDRSAAYMARFAAKNVVAHGHAQRCLVTVSYAIGRADPLMVYAEDEKGQDISKTIRRYFDFRPRAIIERLGLCKPIFKETAAYGHFGRPGFPWEEIVELS